MKPPLVLAALAVPLAGCANCPKEETLDRILPNWHPEHALARFAWYLDPECEDWQSAYTRLAASNRELVGYWEFRLGLPLLKDPRTGIPVLKIIRDSVASRSHLGDGIVQVSFFGADNQAKPLGYLIRVHMVDERAPGAEDADYKVDLLRTVEDNLRTPP